MPNDCSCLPAANPDMPPPNTITLPIFLAESKKKCINSHLQILTLSDSGITSVTTGMYKISVSGYISAVASVCILVIAFYCMP